MTLCETIGMVKICVQIYAEWHEELIAGQALTTRKERWLVHYETDEKSATDLIASLRRPAM
jgi:hypothetical protein